MIKNTNLKKSTIDLYNRVLDKLKITSILDLESHDSVIERINNLSSISYKIMAYRAINCITNSSIYQKEYKDLIQLQNNNDNIGSLPMTLSELLNINVECSNPLQQLVESFTIWINTHYPLRLDYYNVEIVENPQSKDINPINYMTYSDNILTFYLNDFKNVKSFGTQVLTYNDSIICNYIQNLTKYFCEFPKYLLYRYDHGTKSLQPFSSRIYYGEYLHNLLKKYTGKDISMNIIRKIHESELIQSPEYSKMSNSEKKKKHNALLHHTITANNVYNIVNKD